MNKRKVNDCNNVQFPQKRMTNSLTTTVTNILLKRVTDEQAKQFALDNYGVLATYIRQEFIKEISAKNIKTDGNINSRKKKI